MDSLTLVFSPLRELSTFLMALLNSSFALTMMLTVASPAMILTFVLFWRFSFVVPVLEFLHYAHLSGH